MFTRSELNLVKQRALRKSVWFRVLDRVERSIIVLTIRCVQRVRSLRLSEMLMKIVSKLTEAMKRPVERLMDEVGRPLARKLSRIARSWGNISAVGWAEDVGFIQYLAVTYVNAPAMFKSETSRSQVHDLL